MTRGATVKVHGAMGVRGAATVAGMASILGALLLCAPGGAHSQEAPPIARARLDPGGAVTVGQPVELQVEVLVTTWFARAPEFPTLDLDGALVAPPGRSVNFNEGRGSQRYFGIRRAYTLYPQVAGTYEVPALPITVRPGGSDEVVTVSTGPLSFEARVPAEASGLGYFIGTTRLTLTQSVDPPVDSLKVGDALTRTVEMTVVDALSLVLPPLAFDTIPGLAVYPKPSLVTDEGGERGTQRIGRRVESATYVMEAEGIYELPAVEVAWWDLQARRLRRSTVPAISFVVEPNPDDVAEFEPPSEPDSLVADAPVPGQGLSRRILGLGGAAILLFAVLLWLARRFGPSWRARLLQRLRERQESEAAHFARFRAACRANDPALAMRSLLAWLDRVTVGERASTVGAFLTEATDPELTRAVGDLEERLFGHLDPGAGAWQGSQLYRSVRRHRHHRKRASRASWRPGELAPFNPIRNGLA